MSSAGLNTALNVSQPLATTNASVEVMFQQIMHAVHKSVSGCVVRNYYLSFLNLDELISITKLLN